MYFDRPKSHDRNGSEWYCQILCDLSTYLQSSSNIIFIVLHIQVQNPALKPLNLTIFFLLH